MRIPHVCLSAMCVVLFVSFMATAEPVTDEARPKAVVAEPTYEFPEIMEGKKVTHDFIIRNEGSGVLDVKDIKTG